MVRLYRLLLKLYPARFREEFGAPLERQFADQRLTLADTHGLVLMRERRIASCWSTDRHLGLTGVQFVV